MQSQLMPSLCDWVQNIKVKAVWQHFCIICLCLKHQCSWKKIMFEGGSKWGKADERHINQNRRIWSPLKKKNFSFPNIEQQIWLWFYFFSVGTSVILKKTRNASLCTFIILKQNLTKLIKCTISVLNMLP